MTEIHSQGVILSPQANLQNLVVRQTIACFAEMLQVRSSA
jgi:hypothetical protein